MKQGTIRTAGYLTRNELIISLVILIIYAVGVAGLTIQYTGELFLNLIPVILILSLAATLAFHRPSWDLRTAAVFAAIVLSSWIVEAAGVRTGIIFGKYAYGPALGIKLFDTPLLIGFNWLLLVYATSCIADYLNISTSGKIISASLLMVLYDLVLELAAPVLGMWNFEGGAAPARNYITWFIAACLFHSALRITGIKIQNRVAPVIFVIQFLFFIVLVILFHLTK